MFSRILRQKRKRLRALRKRTAIRRRAAGAQLLEFALVLPFLVVFIIGGIDFGSVYNLKQKLNNAAREGARFAANENSLNNLTTNDVNAIRDVVYNYLTNAGVTQCNFSASSPSVSVFTYTYSSGSAGCTGSNFSLVINREYPLVGTTQMGTKVTLTYPYQWSLVNVIGLLAPGSTLSLPATITTDCIMQNLN
jgi:Flp pilus assembly protein TadG